LRLRASRRGAGGVYAVLVFPHSTETRWLERLPTPGTRIRDRGGDSFWGRTWVVDEVLQSGLDTYTVHCVSRGEYRGRFRERLDDRTHDLSAELLEVARSTRDLVSEQVRARKKRNYLP
jgi:hypothetical protein